MRTLKVIIVSTLLAAAGIAFSHAQTTISFTLTTEQEAAMTAVVAVINADRAAQEPPGTQVTVATYAVELAQAKLSAIVRAWKSRLSAEVLTKYEAAPEKAKTDAVKVLEGKATITDVSIEDGGAKP